MLLISHPSEQDHLGELHIRILNKILITVHCIIHVLHVNVRFIPLISLSSSDLSLIAFPFLSPYLVLLRGNYLGNRNIMHILSGCKWKCFLRSQPQL